MNEEEIIALAKRVGFPIHHPEWRKAVEEFAALVEEKATAIEREWLIEYIQEHQPSCKQMIKAIDVRGQA